MREVKLYTFGEKMPNVGEQIIVVPKNENFEYPAYTGTVVNNIEFWTNEIEKEDDPEEIECIQKRIAEIKKNHDELVIEWDDDTEDTVIRTVPEWEWCKVN